MERISKRMKDLRNSLNLTQSEVADKLDVHLNTYKSYEKDASKMPHGVIPGLLDVYGITFEQFYCEVSEKGVYEAIEGRVSILEEQYKNLITD